MKTRASTISNPINDSLLLCALILIPFVLMCVALLPGAQAVSPAPDGGYPGGNTPKGQNALLGLTTGHASSSRRYKEDIKPIDKASEVLFALKPVAYRYKKDVDKTQTLDYGLIAEDVAKVDPNLAIRDKKGQIQSVRYNAINAMLLNEFLKEHRKVQELEQDAVRQQKRIEGLTAGLQKVSAELEASKSAVRRVPKDE